MTSNKTSRHNTQIEAMAGDTPQSNIQDPFDLHFSGEFRQWIAHQGISLALSTYEGAKIIIIGPGMQGGTIVSERNFPRCMALCVDSDRNIYVSTDHCVWQLENGLDSNKQLDGWDRVYLPRKAFITGSVDIHDLAIDHKKRLLGVVTHYNCIAEIGSKNGNFAPLWRPPFISEIIGEDRCHLNGFCLDENKKPAYATIVGKSDEADGWRKHRGNGGIIIDLKTNEIIAENLAMPHTPRLYKGALYFLESGSGWLCRIDNNSGNVEKLLWRPGFLRGLRFKDNYAFLCSSKPRDTTFSGLPIQDELDKRNKEAICAIDVIDIDKMEAIHSVQITGSVKELYDVAILENCRQPLLYGTEGDEIQKIISLGDDTSEKGAFKGR